MARCDSPTTPKLNQIYFQEWIRANPFPKESHRPHQFTRNRSNILIKIESTTLSNYNSAVLDQRMSILERLDIINHYITELQDFDLDEVPAYLSTILCIAEGSAQEIVRLIHQERETILGIIGSAKTEAKSIKSIRKLLRKNGLSKYLARYLLNLNVPDRNYEISIDHESIGASTGTITTYIIYQGLLIKKPKPEGHDQNASAVLVCGIGTPHRYWIEDLIGSPENLEWFDISVHRSNKVTIWPLTRSLYFDGQSLVFQSFTQHIILEEDGSPHLYEEFSEDQALSIPLVDGLAIHTDIGFVTVQFLDSHPISDH